MSCGLLCLRGIMLLLSGLVPSLGHVVPCCNSAPCIYLFICCGHVVSSLMIFLVSAMVPHHCPCQRDFVLLGEFLVGHTQERNCRLSGECAS